MNLSAEPVIPTKPVTMVGKPHPLHMETVRCEVQEGLTLAEMLNGLDVSRLDVRVNGARFPASTHKLVRPKQGSLVEIVAFPQGEFQNENDLNKATQGVTIALAVVAAVVATVATYGGASPVIAGLLSTAITLGGSLIVGATMKLAPIKKPPEPRKFYGIENSQNDARPYGAVPLVLGTVRMVPPVVAEPYSEFLGGTSMYLYLLADFGYGSLGIDQELLNDTALEDFGPSCRWLLGQNPGWVLGDTFTTLPNKSLPTNGDPNVDFPLEVTQNNTEMVTCEVMFDQTFFTKLGNNVSSGHTLIDLYYRAVGGSTWLPVANMNMVAPTLYLTAGQCCVFTTAYQPAEKWSVGGSAPYTHFKCYGAPSPTEPLIITIMFKPPTPGQYEVIMSRTTLAQAGYSDVGGRWTQCRSANFSTPPAKLPTTKGYLTIKAQNANQQLGVLSARVSQLIPAWNGSSWITGQTSNPAYIFRWLLTTCPATLKQVPLSRIDDDAIKAWGAFCAAKGFVYNDIVDAQGTLFDILNRVCAAGRATIAIRDGKYSVVVDDTQTSPVQMFTPRNSAEFSGTRSFAEDVHGFTCRFPNAGANFQTDIRLVYADGYTVDGAGGTLVADPKKMPDLDLPGVTSPDSVWRLAKYQLAVAKYRQNTYSLKTGVENLVCQRGDRVRVAHDVTDWGAGWGRVTSVKNLFMAYSTGVNTASTPSAFPGPFSTASGGQTAGTKFILATKAKVVGLRCDVPDSDFYIFSLWGPDGAITQRLHNPGSGMHTVYFNRPYELEAGEYAVSIYHDTHYLIRTQGGTMHAVAHQNGPLFIPQDAGVIVLGDGSPLLSSGGAVGYCVEPIVVADVSGVPGDQYSNGAGIVQEFELDEEPAVPFLGAGSYAVTIRNAADPTTALVETSAVPSNLARAISSFTRASPTGSYIDAKGALRFTNLNNTQRNTYDVRGDFKGIEVERATTNLCLNSDDLSHASWVKTNVAVQPNQKSWPNQTGSADKVFATDTSGFHELECTPIAVSNGDWIGASVFLHAGTTSWAAVGVKLRDGSKVTVVVDLLTGEITSDQSGTALVETYGDGWWRVSLLVNVGAGAGNSALVLRVLRPNVFGPSFSGQGESFYAVGGMVEKASSVTSYLPSGSVANTRAAETVTLNVPTKHGLKGGLNYVRGAVVLEIDNKTPNLTGVDAYLRFGDFSIFGALYAEEEHWYFGLQYGDRVEGPRVARGKTRIVLSWEPDADETQLAISVNGSDVYYAILADPAFLISSAASDVLPAMGSPAPGNASFTLNRLHTYDDSFTFDEMKAISALDAPIPDSKSFWVGGPSTATGNAARGDLVMLGRPGFETKELMVTQIIPGPELSAEIICTDYVDAVYAADAGTPPAFTSSISTVPYRTKLEAPQFEDFVRCKLSPMNGTRKGLDRLLVVELRWKPPSLLNLIANMELKCRVAFTDLPILYGDLGEVIEPVYTDGTMVAGIGPNDYGGLVRPDTYLMQSKDVTAAKSPFAYFEVFARYVPYAGSPSLWRHLRVKFIDMAVYSLAGVVGAETLTGGQLTASTLALTTTVNGVDLQWTVTNPTLLQNQIAHTISRAPDVAGVPGSWAVLDSILTQGNLVTNYRDPVIDGGTYWYKVESTLTFSSQPSVVTTPQKTKAMQVTDGADVTGNAVLIRVKNPNFDEGDISWIKGTGWTILDPGL